MADTHGFEVIIQSSRNVLVKALKGAWKSAECPDPSGEEGRIPEFKEITAGLLFGDYTVTDGTVHIPQDELDAQFAPDVSGVEIIMGLETQIQIDNPPVPSAELMSFHSILHAKVPVGTLDNGTDVGILLKNLDPLNVWAVLDQGHPLDSQTETLLGEYVHKAYEDGTIQHEISENNISFVIGTCNSYTKVFDDESNINRHITSSFPDPTHLQISLPIYLRLFSFSDMNFHSPMGIETRINIMVPFEKQSNKYIAKFNLVTSSDVTVGTISGAGSDIAGNVNESANYTFDKQYVYDHYFGANLDSLLQSSLQTKGANFANDIGLVEINFPSIDEIQNFIAKQFYNELKARDHVSLWTPTASNNEFQVDNVNVKVFSDSLNIALNDSGSGNLNAISFFIPSGMEFSIATSRQVLDENIQKAIVDNGFDQLPKRYHEDDKDVDLNSINVFVVDGAIRMQGSVTVIDAVLGSIDVDADFTADVGLHWDPNGSLNSDGAQQLKHHQIGEPDVDMGDNPLLWIITLVSFLLGGFIIGIIVIIIIGIIKSIAEKTGSDAVGGQISSSLDSMVAWPPDLSRVGRVTAVFFDPVDISTSGMVISGIFNVISSCETVQVVPAKTESIYSIKAAQLIELKALNVYSQATYFWNPGDGSLTSATKNILHKYANSGIYIAKHGLKVTEPGGAKSRRFAIVKVENVPPIVNAGADLTVNEGDMISLSANFEDVEYADTHESVWNFGDNQALSKGVVQETHNNIKSYGTSKVQHAWCDQGEYFVTCLVIDNNGGIGTDTIKVTVKNVPPVVKSPEKIHAYLCSPITLVADFKDPGWCDTHVATWKFGDCSFERMAIVEETNYAPAAKGTATCSHTYKKCGTFLSKCTVIDDDGGIGISETKVEVVELKNSCFNDGFTYDPNGKVANYWKPLFGNDDIKILNQRKKNEIFFCEKCLVFDGLSSQRIINGGKGITGIYQIIGANIKWEYQFNAMYQLVNGNSAKIKLGIDPAGGTDPNSTGILWSSGLNKGEWSNITARAVSKADKITVFLCLETEDSETADCCFDCVELIAMQNTKCDDPEKPAKPQRKCVEFRDIDLKTSLPPEYTQNRVKFTAVDNKANRIAGNFPQNNNNCLEIRHGMLIEFPETAKDVSIEFSYSKDLKIVATARDSKGNTLFKQAYELNKGKKIIHFDAENIKNIHIFTEGRGAIAKICFI